MDVNMSTRLLELATCNLGITGMVLAQIPSSDLTWADSIAKMSPTALMAVFLVVLWRRYTQREDAMEALAREAITAIQRISDIMDRKQ